MDSALEGFYINLDDAHLRRQRIEEMLRSAKVDGFFKRFPALRPEKSQGQLTKGAVGCLDSHLGILRTRNSNDFTIILEDDAVISPHFKSDLLSTLKAAGFDWHILFLVHTEPINDVERMKALIASCQSQKLLSQDRPTMIEAKSWYRYGTVGYIVSPSMPSSIVDEVERLALTRQLPIDGIYQQLISAGLIKAKIAFPYIVGVGMEHASQIGRGGNVRDELHAVLINLFYRHRSVVDISRWLAEEAVVEDDLEAKVASKVYFNYIKHC